MPGTQHNDKICSVLQCTNKAIIIRTFVDVGNLGICSFNLCKYHACKPPFDINEDILEEKQIMEA